MTEKLDTNLQVINIQIIKLIVIFLLRYCSISFSIDFIEIDLDDKLSKEYSCF